VISIAIYKIVSLMVGIGFAYMGYRLFMAGIWGEAGDVSGEFGDNKIVVKRAAPGTFFAIAGAIIISLTIMRGFELENKQKESVTTSQNMRPDLPQQSPFSNNE
jgi:hypothetical protein